MAKEQSKTKSFVLRIVNGQLQWLIDDALRRSGRLPAKKHD